MKRALLLLLPATLLLLTACGSPLPPTEATLTPDTTKTINVPPAKARYLLLRGASGPNRITAQTTLPRGPQLRIVLLNEDLNPMLASADFSWFGLPRVAVAARGMKPLIVPIPTDGVRLDFDARLGHDYYLRVENLSGVPVDVEVGLSHFDPNPNGDWLSNDTLALDESKTGAIEFVGERDAYTLVRDGYLHLSAQGAATAFLVADVYEDAAPGASKLASLEPESLNCLRVYDGNFVIVHTRGDLTAGFDEPDSLQYTLTHDNSACP